MDFFTSDTHFGHVNIREYCNRPGKDVDEMNNIIIARWNSVVSDNDTVYHLGDFAMGKKDLWKSYRDQLNGSIVLFAGNHDTKEILNVVTENDYIIYREDFVYTCPITGVTVSLAHLPVGCIDDYRGRPLISQRKLGEPQGDMYFCGHVHREWLVDFKTGCINVGVDQWNYIPKTLKQIRDSLGAGSKVTLREI